MKKYKIRVIEEKIEIDTKIKKLSDFILSKRKIPQKESDLMRKQLSIMRNYSACLSERIRVFSCDPVFFEKWTLLMLKTGIL